MMRARVNLITADPDRMADTIGYIKTSVRPAIDSMDGSLGLSLYANAEIGVAVLESFWASREALIRSEQMAAPRRTDVVRRAVGTVSVERYRVPVGDGASRTGLAIGYVVAGGIMIVGGLVEIVFGIDADGKPLEQIAAPLTAVES